MSVIYTDAVKVSRMTSVVTSLGGTSVLRLYTAADVLLATFPLAATAGTVAGAGVLTLSDANGALAGILNTTAVAAGTATKAALLTGALLNIITGLTVSATGGGGDLVLDNNVIANTQAITINSGTISHAA